MGKLIVTAQMTVDGVIDTDLGWLDTAEQEGRAEDEVRLAHGFLLGRKTFEGIAPYWKQETYPFAQMVNRMPKYVVSRSLRGPLDWNASLIEGDVAEAINRLKQEHEGNLISYGCGELAFELVKFGVIDEVHFWVHPVIWGEAHRPFHGLGRVRLTSLETTVFGSGVALHKYHPAVVDA
jgi:dihydrofolate reductase